MYRLKPYETGDERPQRSATCLAKRASPPVSFLIFKDQCENSVRNFRRILRSLKNFSDLSLVSLNLILVLAREISEKNPEKIEEYL